MFFCRDCGKQFRDTYNLTKHMSRVKPCVPVRSTGGMGGDKNSALPPKNTALPPKNSALPPKNSALPFKNPTEIPKKDTFNCVYCMCLFKSKWYKNKHQDNCKHKDDPIRLLEIENNIEIDIPENKLECRFCNLVFARTDNLNKHIPVCKERERYHKNLQEYIKPVQSNVIINNNNNITINGNVNIINSIDLDIEEYLYFMKAAAEEYNRSDIPKIAGESLCLINKELSKRNPEYQIITFPYLNSMYANEKTESGIEMISVEKGFNRILKSTSKNILTHGKEIDNYDRENKIVGNFEGTNLRLVPQVMKEVQAIEKMGVISPEISHSVLNSLKMNNLEK